MVNGPVSLVVAWTGLPAAWGLFSLRAVGAETVHQDDGKVSGVRGFDRDEIEVHRYSFPLRGVLYMKKAEILHRERHALMKNFVRFALVLAAAILAL